MKLHYGQDTINSPVYDPYSMALFSVFVYTHLLLVLNFTKIKTSLGKAGAIWNYFDKPAKFNDTDADVNLKVKCKVCSHVSYLTRATFNLITHLQVQLLYNCKV
jgi:hypothetical protein